MRKLLNCLFVTSEDVYLALDGENIVVYREKEIVSRYPLHILSEIFCFSYKGASPALMGACAERNITLSFITPKGKFLARACGKTNGNVLLRRKQYRIADDPIISCEIARNFIFGKIYNCRWSIERTLRDHKLRVDAEKLKKASDQLKELLPIIKEETNMESLRGIEGKGATVYFNVLDDLILNMKSDFYFKERNRRPPLDNVNAMLSFVYVLLANSCASALESIGLDSYVGFMHTDRSGRTSLALDLMEELRPCFADRFVLTLINNKIMNADCFEKHESGAVLLNEIGRKKVLEQWQKKKQEEITHPYLEEKMQWGLVPFIQALLLSRYLREDLDAYPPFLWK